MYYINLITMNYYQMNIYHNCPKMEQFYFTLKYLKDPDNLTNNVDPDQIVFQLKEFYNIKGRNLNS